jgi:hypothetical protein
MNGVRLGSHGLRRVQTALSERDLEIIRFVGDLRLMSAGQLEALCFPSDAHATPLTARRVARRVLERLTRDRLLVRLERRIGGVSSGSAGYIYALGPVGARVLTTQGQRRHFREPSASFAAHTLAISQLAVDLTVEERHGDLEMLAMEAEPRCWRQFGGLGGKSLLRPDLFVSLGLGDLEHRWFIEMDLGSEHVPTLVRKCQLYARYYQSGIEQGRHGVFPRVCWVLPNQRRIDQLASALRRSGDGVDGLFVMTMPEPAVLTLVGGQA